jgi:FkbM family methyltransferase
MKVSYGEKEVLSAAKFGLKPLAAKILLLKPINIPVRLFALSFLPLRIARKLPLGIDSVKFAPVSAEPVVLLDPHRDLHARDIFWGSGRPTSPADDRVLRCVERLCSEASTFADIGAFAGLFAMLAARANPALRAFAYEIAPENFILLVRNVIENDLVSRVICKPLGLAKDPGSIRIPASLGLSSNPSSTSIGSYFRSGVEIPLTTLDAESRCWKGPCAMKIDVEGFESDVLEGGRETIARLKPDIICEVLPGLDDGSCNRIEGLLRPLGYRLFQCTADAFIERKGLIPDDSGHDWLFSARPDVDTIIGECK